jgi:hypothetical protein
MYTLGDFTTFESYSMSKKDRSLFRKKTFMKIVVILFALVILFSPGSLFAYTWEELSYIGNAPVFTQESLDDIFKIQFVAYIFIMLLNFIEYIVGGKIPIRFFK